MRITVRKADLNDLAALSVVFANATRMLVAQSKEGVVVDGFDWTRHVEAKLEDGSKAFFVAFVDGDLAGVVVASTGARPKPRLWNRMKRRFRREAPQSPFTAVSMGILTDCYVEPAFRRLGVASLLVENACVWLHECGVERVAINVLLESREAIDFWRGRGFRPKFSQMYRQAKPIDFDVNDST